MYRGGPALVFLMISFAKGNLLEAKTEAVVNTVNTVGVMGKGIALMFKESFPENFKAYKQACAAKKIVIGRVFVTEHRELLKPRWVINFPTKEHWRTNTKPEWIREGLIDLARVIREHNIRSIAIPPLGCGNGGLDWRVVRPMIVAVLEQIDDLEAIIYEPTPKYQNIVKRKGTSQLTPARAMIAEMVRRYDILDLDCSILEVQKLAWFIERGCERFSVDVQLDFDFKANIYGPYSDNLRHMLDKLDGSYLHCDKRLADAGPLDLIRFDNSRKNYVSAYMKAGDGKAYQDALEWVDFVIDGFQSPYGMELIATVDWLIEKEGVSPTVQDIVRGLRDWPGNKNAGQRKLRIFDKRVIGIALEHLRKAKDYGVSSKGIGRESA